MLFRKSICPAVWEKKGNIVNLWDICLRFLWSVLFTRFSWTFWKPVISCGVLQKNGTRNTNNPLPENQFWVLKALNVMLSLKTGVTAQATSFSIDISWRQLLFIQFLPFGNAFVHFSRHNTSTAFEVCSEIENNLFFCSISYPCPI